MRVGIRGLGVSSVPAELLRAGMEHGHHCLPEDFGWSVSLPESQLPILKLRGLAGHDDLEGLCELICIWDLRGQSVP